MKRLSPRVRRAILFASIVILAAFSAYRLLTPLDQARGFHLPDAAEARAASTRFAEIVAGGSGAAPAGLYRRVESDVVVLSERDGDCRGRGSYLLRGATAVPLAILAPHRGSDLQTGALAAALFDDGAAAAAAWNSAPRRVGEGCPGGDPARHETHYLTAFSLAFAEVYPHGRIVQLHGFDGDKRRSRAAQLADIIVSEGTEAPNPRLYDLADCLSQRLHPWRVAVFPGDVGELGALQNRQGQALRAAGFTGFAHLEMARHVRRELVADPQLRGAFARCLQTGLQ